MTHECEFCGESFDSENRLHRHWKKHEDELNSHQKDKMKKARREHQEQKQKKQEERRRMLFYGSAIAAAIVLIGVVAFQLTQTGGKGTQTQTFNLEGQPMLGNPNASVTVVEFGDYRCSACKQFHETVYPRLKNRFIKSGQINFYFVGFSFLDQYFKGDTSKTASVAAECVYKQDKQQFWNMHEAIYNNRGPEKQDWGTKAFLMELARNHTEGLNYTQLESCIAKRKTIDEVREDRRMARSHGVDSTPTIFVNGKQVENSYPAVSSAIKQALQ